MVLAAQLVPVAVDPLLRRLIKHLVNCEALMSWCPYCFTLQFTSFMLFFKMR